MSAVSPSPGNQNVFLRNLASSGLDSALKGALNDEAELRRLFARERAHDRLKDPHVGLVDVFATAPSLLVTSDAPIGGAENHIFPVSSERRRSPGSPAVVQTLADFERNWSIFTEGSLSQLNWSNVIVAGGAVQACLAPLPSHIGKSKKDIRKFFHWSEAYAGSDVDLFLYGLNAQQAEEKIVHIFDAVRDAVPWEVTAVRTAHAVTIHSQYPHRPVQIVLRLYASPAEVLAGFDVDCCSVAYSLGQVLATPRALAAHMRQSNVADTTRRSPSYEVRLAKYAARGFSVYVDGLRRADVDPQIFERSIGRIQGLARLLVLEKLRDAPSRAQYISKRAELRGRPVQNPYETHEDRGRKGDLKAKGAFADLDVELSGYDRGTLRIPYGPGWHSARIEKLIWKNDMGVNTPFNPRNDKRRLHRHLAFFGTVQECMEDCCGACPTPENEEEEKLQKDEDEAGAYVRGRISFLADDPGRQTLSGSFRPLDADEWAVQAYIHAQGRLLEAVVVDDVSAIKAIVANAAASPTPGSDSGPSGTQAEKLDLNARDATGRTPLHIALLSGSRSVALALIEMGARMAPRLVGGRTSLHLAAQGGMAEVVEAMLARNEQNKREAEKEAEAQADVEAAEAASDLSMSDKDDAASVSSDKPEAPADVLEESVEDAPDVFDPSAPDWDFGFTPLIYAVISGSLQTVSLLLAAGVSPTEPTKTGLHPLTAVLLSLDPTSAPAMARALVQAGASSSAADSSQYSILHRAVATPGFASVVAALISSDPKARVAQDLPMWPNAQDVARPIDISVALGNWAALAILLAHGAQLNIGEADVSRALDVKQKAGAVDMWRTLQVKNWRARVCNLIEVAVARGDGVDAVRMLLALGVTADVPPKEALAQNDPVVSKQYASLADWADTVVKTLDATIEEKIREASRATDDAPMAETERPDAASATSWDEWRVSLYGAMQPLRLPSRHTGPRLLGSFGGRQSSGFGQHDLAELQSARARFADISALLHEHTVTTPGAGPPRKSPTPAPAEEGAATLEYFRLQDMYGGTAVPSHLRARYDQLYEAVWTGDNGAIQALCIDDVEEPLQVAVRACIWHVENQHNMYGYTPLMIAIERKHWATARLILAITKAQYKAPEQSRQPRDEGVDDEEDDSDNDEDSDEDMDDAPAPLTFTDIAARPSAVQCPVSPLKLLDAEGMWIGDGQLFTGSVLQRTVYDDDLRAFESILELYAHAQADPASTWMTLDQILRQDRPDFLDAYIRFTGEGIHPIDPLAPPQDDSKAASKDTERVYYGLDIHGKKRKDMRPSGPHQIMVGVICNVPVRQAAGFGAVRVLEYFASSRALAAYQAYVASHPDTEQARNIAKAGGDAELARAMRSWFGWGLNMLNESALLNAVVDDKLAAVKSLFELEPEMKTGCLNARAKYSGLTALLAAVRVGAHPDLFDYLLERGADPEVCDARGWNVFHIFTVMPKDEKHTRLVDHVLKTLPQDLSLSLLSQQSRGAQNTPLMLAVKNTRPDLVACFTALPLPDATYLSRDASASTALHIAAQQSDLSIIRSLVQAGPAELLQVENGVGQTALEIASQRLLAARSANGHGSLPPIKWSVPLNLEQEHVQAQVDVRVSHQGLRATTEELRSTLDELLNAGMLARTMGHGKALLEFADRLQAQLETLTTADVEKDAVEATHGVLRDAARARPTPRRPIHVLDVQRSVERDVARAAAEKPQVYAYQRSRNQDLPSVEEQLKNASVFADSGGIFGRGSAIDWFSDEDSTY